MTTEACAVRYADDRSATQLRAFAGDLIYTEGMPADHLYVVKEGEVDLFVQREGRRVVVETLRRGDSFGLAPHLPRSRRTTHAAARTYCELLLVDGGRVAQEVAAASELAQSMLGNLSQRLAAAHELIARRVNWQPDLQMYAQLLQLLGQAELARAAPAGARRREPPAGAGAGAARVLLQDVFTNARLMFGHSDQHIRGVVGKFVALHLAQIEDDDGQGKRLKFMPRELPAMARKAVDAGDEGERLSYETIGIDEFAALVDVERGVLLRKLADGDFTDELFAFRRAELLKLLDAKGRGFFADRRLKTPEEFEDIRDLEFADAKTLFSVVSGVDTLELAKVLATLEDGPARQKILGSLSRSRREELDSDLDGLPPPDPVEVRQTAARIVKDVKAALLRR